jgi:hypothetical protein
MSNPFNNVKVQDSREYLKNKSNISKFQTLKGKRDKFLNTGLICNNKLVHINGHSNLLNFTKGYYLTKSCCYDKRGTAHDITDGRYTYFDFNDVDVQYVSSKGIEIKEDVSIHDCNIIKNYDIYELDVARMYYGVKKGLCKSSKSKISPKFKTKMFKLHKTNSMVIKPNDCDIKFKNNYKPPLVHNVHGGLLHTHHFPTNTVDVTYFHKHGGNGVKCPKFHSPHPHPSQKTNHYYLSKNYSSDDMLGLEKSVKVKKYYSPKKYYPPHNGGSLNFGKINGIGCGCR